MHPRKMLFVFLVLMALALPQHASCCSAYKITANDKTIMGSNHDTWYITPRIWFETEGYGTGFTGARIDMPYGIAPQAGMNEHGLCFTRLAAATPKNGAVPTGKKTIASQTLFLKEVMHLCKTAEEVKAYVDQYDHSLFINDVMLYVDKAGNYVVVEPYTTSLGYDSTYVIANFCPSQVPDLSTVKQPRYVDGVAFLKNNKTNSSITFATALSDTMHVCRPKLGDGTLMTLIRDANEGMMYLYFYHDYEHVAKFDLKQELAKGDHMLDVASLFPDNTEFKKLADFKTPVTSPKVDLFLRFCFGLFLLSACFYFIAYFRRSATTKFAYVRLLLFPLSLLLAYYMFVLGTNQNIFYFPAPYKDYKFSMVTVSSYFPFILLLLIIPLLVLNARIIKQKAWGIASIALLSLNNVVYLVLIGMFVYWGLYAV